LSTETAKPFALSDVDFFSTLKSEALLVTDFWAAWCPPCKAMEPVIEELATEYSGKVKFAKVDVDANPVTAQQFGIMSIPTFLITNRGKVLDVLIGAVPKKEFEASISKYL
jgi:thioredoxin 1